MEQVDYDSVRDHEFDWAFPTQIVEELRSPPGRAAFRLGYVMIGLCAMGGDAYFINPRTSDNENVGLFRVYYDWYDSDAGGIALPDGIREISRSFADVVRVGEFD